MRETLLVVSLLLDPSSGVSTNEITTDLVVDEDDDCEGKSREPPREAKAIHSETVVQSRAVAHEGCEGSLEDEAEVESPVGHA